MRRSSKKIVAAISALGLLSLASPLIAAGAIGITSLWLLDDVMQWVSDRFFTS